MLLDMLLINITLSLCCVSLLFLINSIFSVLGGIERLVFIVFFLNCLYSKDLFTDWDNCKLSLFKRQRT